MLYLAVLALELKRVHSRLAVRSCDYTGFEIVAQRGDAFLKTDRRGGIALIRADGPPVYSLLNREFPSDSVPIRTPQIPK